MGGVGGVSYFATWGGGSNSTQSVTDATEEWAHEYRPKGGGGKRKTRAREEVAVEEEGSTTPLLGAKPLPLSPNWRRWLKRRPGTPNHQPWT